MRFVWLENRKTSLTSWTEIGSIIPIRILMVLLQVTRVDLNELVYPLKIGKLLFLLACRCSRCKLVVDHQFVWGLRLSFLVEWVVEERNGTFCNKSRSMFKMEGNWEKGRNTPRICQVCTNLYCHLCSIPAPSIQNQLRSNTRK